MITALAQPKHQPWILTLASALLTWLAIGTSVPAAEVNQDFEGRLPGQESIHWRPIWGKKGDDLLIITNDTAMSGKQSLMLDRVTGTNDKMWGAITALPKQHASGHRIRFAFRYEGPGNVACPSMEFRVGYQKRLLYLKWGHNRFTLESADNSVQREHARQTFGKLKRSQWYIVEMNLEAWRGNAERAKALATLWEPGKESERQTATVHLPKIKGPATFLYLNIPQGKRGFRFYLDTLSIGPLATKLPSP